MFGINKNKEVIKTYGVNGELINNNPQMNNIKETIEGLQKKEIPLERMKIKALPIVLVLRIDEEGNINVVKL